MKLILVVILFSFQNMIISAQTPSYNQEGVAKPKITGSEAAKKATDKLNELIHLSPAQYDKVLKINKEFQLNMQKVFSEGKDNAVEITKDMENKLKAILTEEQSKQLPMLK